MLIQYFLIWSNLPFLGNFVTKSKKIYDFKFIFWYFAGQFDNFKRTKWQYFPDFLRQLQKTSIFRFQGNLEFLKSIKRVICYKKVENHRVDFLFVQSRCVKLHQLQQVLFFGTMNEFKNDEFMIYFPLSNLQPPST